MKKPSVRRERPASAATARSLRLVPARRALAEDLAMKVQARDELLSIVAHDLRNPVKAADLWATILQQNAPAGELGDNIRLVTSKIRVCVEEMSALIRDLADLGARAGAGLRIERTRNEASSLIQTVVDSFEPISAQKCISLRAEAPEVPPLLCDAPRIRQVLGNLVGNAIKFTENGGGIVLGARAVGREACFSVCDDGPGIAKSALGRVFDRYWTTHDTTGMGLGLFIAKSIVEAHDGRIWVESAPAQGTAFHFTLPLA